MHIIQLVDISGTGMADVRCARQVMDMWHRLQRYEIALFEIAYADTGMARAIAQRALVDDDDDVENYGGTD